MLLHIREKAQSWIAFAIVGMLIIGLTTVVWDGFFSPDPEVPVAKVNGEKITSNEFQFAYQQQRARLQNMLGGADISQFIPDEDEFKKNVLKRLEEEELILQAANEAGFRISDGLLAQQIRSIDAFQTDGQFDQEMYQRWLMQNSMSPGMFEDMLRRDVIIQQYRMAVAATGWSTEQERNALVKLQEQQRDVGYMIISAANYLEQVNVSDEDVQKYYDENSMQFVTEEKVSIEYLELKVDDLAKDVDIDEAKLLENYQDRQSEFGVPEERRTRHILIEVAGDASEEELNSAQEKTELLVQQIRDGASFEDIAKEHSDDIGSANDGGDLGYMTRDMMMDPAFADVAFVLEEGAVSDAVKSAYGFHIIKVEAIKTGQQKTFEEVRAQLEREYRNNQAEDIFFEQGEILANLTFENPDTLEIAAQELDLSVKSSPLFSRDQGVGIAMDNNVRSTAFSEEVLLQGLNSQPLELGGDRVLVLRIKEHNESMTRPFDEVKQQISDQLLQERAQAKAEEEGKIILSALTADGDVESLAKERDISWSHPEPIKRNAREIDLQIVQKVFRMSGSEDGQITYDGLVMSSGDYAVIAFYGEIDNAEASVDENLAETMKAQRERYYGANELLGAMADMRQTADIKEFPENF